MNILIQNILVLLVFAFAIGFLIRKFFLKPSTAGSKKKRLDSCGKSDCGCH
ncbi:FeoB-associated Cys-rich membrane protein [Aquimarina mytili]|uniref:FeoB-associated Cys-rich membrane protein n=1 Tax=Aquimarina mytili TaxID=874423 RepID=A0A936ZRF8_9FLAO|nr:FeoB-associated Cys-rich membrane protein [Aquimarina mytili]MBL0684032.1 FeoB-associated Cys-rich membrane protein [Aquimarina mytili]